MLLVFALLYYGFFLLPPKSCIDAIALSNSFFLVNVGIEYVMVETETDYIAKSELALFLSLVHLDVLWS